MNTISPCPHFVYELVDPRDQSIFYVGITTNLLQRFKQHMRYDGTNPYKDRRIQEILASGHLPIMRTVEQVNGFEQALEHEADWILRYLAMGIGLLNLDIPTLTPSLDAIDREVVSTGKKQRSFPSVVAMLMQVRKTGQWPSDLSLPMRRHYMRRYPEFFAIDRTAAKMREKRMKEAEKTLKDRKRRGRL